MLWLERQIVAATGTSDDERLTTAIEQFVASTLDAMPTHLRAGVALESVGLGLVMRVRRGRRPEAAAVREELASWEHVPVSVVRLYPKLFTSLVLLARYELGPA
jgi:hypothetical protein